MMLSDLVHFYKILRDAPGISRDALFDVSVGHAPGGNSGMPADYGIVPLPPLARQYAFVFRLKTGARMHLSLIDKVQFEARILGVHRRAAGGPLSNVAPYDICIGYGGLDVHYDVLSRLGFEYRGFSDKFDSGCEAYIKAFNLDLAAQPAAPICNVHAMLTAEQPPEPGTRIKIDGYSAAIWFSGDPELRKSVGGARAWRGSHCVWYVPASVDLPKLADDVLFFDEMQVENALKAINPVMHLSEQRRLQRVPDLQLRHWQHTAGILKATNFSSQ